MGSLWLSVESLLRGEEVMILTEVISFGLGVVLRIWNEERKASAENHKLQMAVATQKYEILQNQQKAVAGSSFLQFMMMCMIFVAMGVLVAFPLIAAVWDIPLFILHSYVQETGILFWKGTKTVTEWMEISGLYLPEEFQILLVEAIKFIFGAVVGGIGRR